MGRGAFIWLLVCLLNQYLSPFDLSFAAFDHFVEFGDDAITFLKSLRFALHICLFKKKIGIGRLIYLNLTMIKNITIVIIRNNEKYSKDTAIKYKRKNKGMQSIKNFKK